MSRPVVHCITNAVTAARVADALAAAGADPILASGPEEVATIAAAADAVVLNCGTPSNERFAALGAAAAAARAAGRPLVLDPVGCGASPWRTAAIRALAAATPGAVVRGNAAEIAALAGRAGPALGGVRSLAAGPAELQALARAAHARFGGAVLVTGAGTDVLADPTGVCELAVDATVLGRVVGGGDVLSALVGAWLGRGLDAAAAVRGAHAAFAAAAAGAATRGPGGFWPAFLDGLAAGG